MEIKYTTIKPINFQGLWSPANIRKWNNGYKPCDRYMSYTLHDFIYRPFINETAEEIANAINKFIKGRSFDMVDKQEGQKVGVYYQMNRVKIGEAINEEDVEKYLKEGFSRKLSGGISTKKEFWAAMSNDSYSAMDYRELSPEEIEKLASKIFDKTV